MPHKVAQIVDITTLEPQKDSYINTQLQEPFSDLLFKAETNGKDGYLYFLFEHKSYPSKDIALQLLKYMASIWEAKHYKGKKENEKRANNEKLPIIIPIVVYHGKSAWNETTTLGEILNGFDALPESVQTYVPNLKTLLYDLTKYTDEEIKGAAKLRITVRIFRDIFACVILERLERA